jgi:hypothetical protein
MFGDESGESTAICRLTSCTVVSACLYTKHMSFVVSPAGVRVQGAGVMV